MSDPTADQPRPVAETAVAASDVPAAVFQVVASGENVVMVNTRTGQTWAMITDGTRPVWHPVDFQDVASYAPLRPARRKVAG